MSQYTQRGYESRIQYLDSLAEEHNINPDTVYVLADLLGANEDFDGLVTELEDYAIQGISE